MTQYELRANIARRVSRRWARRAAAPACSFGEYTAFPHGSISRRS